MRYNLKWTIITKWWRIKWLCYQPIRSIKYQRLIRSLAHRVIKRARSHSPSGSFLTIEKFGGVSVLNLLGDIHYYQSRLDSCIKYIKHLEAERTIKQEKTYGTKGE